MTEEKNISFKKTLRIGLTAVLVAGFLAVLLAASARQGSVHVADIHVHLNEENANSFLQKKEIKNKLLQNRDIKASLASIDKLDLKQMEQIAETDPWVANAEIYVDNRDILQMDITQREPVARIFCANGSGFYLDSALKEMPVGLGYAFPAPVFTNVTILRNDSMNQVLKRKMAALSMVIQADSFWNAQIEQIEVQPDQTFVLIPLLGNQKIILGDTSRLKEKLDNLFAFYKQVSGKVGWNAYQTLDLRYKGQIIAAPSLETPVPKSNFPADIVGAPEVLNKKVEGNAKTTTPETKAPATAKTNPAKKRTVPKSTAGVSKVKQPSKTKTTNHNSSQHAAKKEVKPKYIYPGK